MFIKKSYKVRHKLLGVLFDHGKNLKQTTDIKANAIHFKDISSKLPDFDKSILLDNLDFLRASEEIYCSMQFDNSLFAIYSAGNHSYRDKKYIREGIKDQMNYIYDIVKTISVIALLCIAVWTFAQNIYQTNQNKIEIQRLQLELKKISDKTQTNFPTKSNR